MCWNHCWKNPCHKNRLVRWRFQWFVVMCDSGAKCKRLITFVRVCFWDEKETHSKVHENNVKPTMHSMSLFILSWLCGQTMVGVAADGHRRIIRPNIVMFVADDLGWGDLSVFGHPTQEPGAVDRMAAEGIRFTQWYAAASTCTPSRAALLTGLGDFRQRSS